MRMLKRYLALVMAAAVLLAQAPSIGHAEKEDSISETYVLAPLTSEGVTAAELYSGSMEIEAHEVGSRLVFDEPKGLSFEVVYGEGWSSCGTYSNFFPDDARASVTETEPGRFEYCFSAVEGESVQLSEWNSVSIYASCAELPKLYIDAALPFDEIGKEDWVDADFTLTLGTKQFSTGDFEGSGAVKGRGNTSWTYPKKPYSIKLDSKTSLLDIPKTKKYAIIPSYYDGSLMRNFITYKIWQGLTGIDYVPKCEFVDVYLNGEYNGIYILVERIDIEKNKIDIDEADADNLSGGYLIEKDIAIKVDFDNDIWFNCPYWANQSQDYFVLKAPEPDDDELRQAMTDYLESYMQSVHDAIMGESGEDYARYVDVSSWIDFIILQEIAKNIDGNMKTSCYMYKDRDDDHLYMTAPWDFDLAYGRVSWDNASQQHNDVDDCPPANTADGFMIVNSSNPWMDKLYDTSLDFRAALMIRYTEYRSTLIEDMFRLINEQAAYLAIVQEPNHELWGMSFTSGVGNLRNWLTQRVEWLDSQWLTTQFAPGDVNMDGAVNSADALLVLRRAIGAIPSAGNEALADVNGDGEITSADALMILRMSMGIIPSVGAE